MKTNPTSIRFNKEELNLAKAKSGIKSVQKLIDFLISEYVEELKKKPLSFKKNDTKSTRSAETFNAFSGVEIKYTKSVPVKPITIEQKIELHNAENKDQHTDLIKAHSLWKPNDPGEGTMAFMMKYNCSSYKELEEKLKNK